MNQGISHQAASVMLAAKRPTTHKQYSTYLKAWFSHCNARNLQPYSCPVPLVIDFLHALRTERNLGYSALNTARSALSSILFPYDNVPFGQHPLVKDYLRGAYNLNPPRPRYTDTWDPKLVLDVVKDWFPVETLDLKRLTLKTVALVLLVSGQRIQTLPLLLLDNMTCTSSYFAFTISDLLKQSRPGYRNPRIVLRAFTADERLCIYKCLDTYIRRTSVLRNGANALFITYKKPHSTATKDTITRWVRDIMHLAGIDTANYAPHSIRSASSSAAKRGGAPVQAVLDTVGWSNHSVFAKFYDKPLKVGVTYDVAVLS